MNIVQTFFSTRKKFLFLLFFAFVVYGISYCQRYSSYSYWLDHSETYVVEDVTAMSGNDSYYWLKVARELDAGTLGKGLKEPTKAYPDQGLLTFKDTPSLLAYLISFGKNFTGGDYYRSGLLLIPLLSGLFVFPLFYYFSRFGLGTAAIFGGLVGTYSDAYNARTKMGRLDTDLLNLFFPLVVGCFILLINKEKSLRTNAGLAVAAGLTMFLYVSWYQQASVILVYFCVMATYLFFARVPWKQSVFLLLIFLLFCGPTYVQQTAQSVRLFLQAYVSPSPTGSIGWPNILTTIGEAQARGVFATLEKLHGFMPLVFLGLAGLAYLCIRHFKQMIPVAPLLFWGGWSLVGPNRFAMYLAPFIGIGIGVLIELLVKWGGRRIIVFQKWGPAVSVAMMFSLFFSATAYTGFPPTPEPFLNAPTTRALLDIKKIVPQHSAMFTPYWEYGYPLMEITDLASYHDGGAQGGIRSTLAAIAMTTNEQKEMASFLSYIEDHGFNQLAKKIRDEKLSAAEMRKLVFEYPKEFSGDNVYVLYLEKMIWKIFSMTKIGSWDFEQRTSKPTDYVELHCFSMVDNVMRCSDGSIDLNRGFMNDGSTDIPLRGALFVDNGYVVTQKDYPHESGYYLQVLMKNGKAFLTLVADGPLYRTNFNQQYLLGNYDRRYFEEVYNNFPVARVFKVKKNNSNGVTGTQ